MTWGDYTRCMLGHKIKELSHLREYRNKLAAALHQEPRKLFELPGDFDRIPSQNGTEENLKILAKHGYTKEFFEKIKKGEC